MAKKKGKKKSRKKEKGRTRPPTMSAGSDQTSDFNDPTCATQLPSPRPARDMPPVLQLPAANNPGAVEGASATILKKHSYEFLLVEILVAFALAMLLAAGFAPVEVFNWPDLEELPLPYLVLRTHEGDFHPITSLYYKDGDNYVKVDLTSLGLRRDLLFESRSSSGKPRSIDALYAKHEEKFSPVEMNALYFKGDEKHERIDTNMFYKTRERRPFYAFRYSKGYDGNSTDKALQVIVFFLICLWIVKFVQEKRLIYFFEKQGHGINLATKHVVGLHFCTLVFLFSMYSLISYVYLNNSGAYYTSGTIGLLCFSLGGYWIPDIIYGRRVWGTVYKALSKPVNSSIPDSVEGKVLKFWKRVTKRWLWEDLITVLAVATLSVLLRTQPENSKENWCMVVVVALVINLSDWCVNRFFFWDENSFEDSEPREV